MKYRRQIAEGEDPFITKKEAKKQRRLELNKQKTLTVLQLIEQFKTNHYPNISASTQKNYSRTLKNHIAPRLGTMKINQVKRSDITAIIEHLLNKENKPYEAKAVHSTFSKLFAYALDKELINDVVSISTDLKKTLNKRNKPREIHYTNEQINAHWNLIEQIERPQVKAYFKCLYYLGLRRNELYQLEWEHIKEADKQIIIPSINTKEDRPHTIPIPDAVEDIINELRGLTGGCKYVFSDEINERPFLGDDSTIKKIKKEVGVYSPHDVRRTCRTKWAEIGIKEEVSERMIGHAQDRLKATYNRHSFIPEMARAYNHWALELHKIIGLIQVQEIKRIG